MRRFSERLGHREFPISGPKDAADALRTAIWNVVYPLLSDHNHFPRSQQLQLSIVRFARLPIDALPQTLHGGASSIRPMFLESPWAEFYDLVEFLLLALPPGYDDKWWNRFLEQEGCAYRFARGQLVPVTDSHEVDAIVEAGGVKVEPFEGVRNHIAAAVAAIASKPHPDYRNCIKESISAVESVLWAVNGSKSPNIGTALSALEKVYPIHPALREAMSRLYGWTSDESGLRHAIFEETATGSAEAKFALITCSAFVNLVVSKTLSSR